MEHKSASNIKRRFSKSMNIITWEQRPAEYGLYVLIFLIMIYYTHKLLHTDRIKETFRSRPHMHHAKASDISPSHTSGRRVPEHFYSATPPQHGSLEDRQFFLRTL